MNKVAVRWVLRMLIPELHTGFWRTNRTIPTWSSENLFHNSLFRMKRQTWNVDPPLEFSSSEQQSMQW